MDVGGIVPEWDLADRLRKSLRVAGMSQSDMAAELGVSRKTVSAYVNGLSFPRRPALVVWALRTGSPLPWLLGERERS